MFTHTVGGRTTKKQQAGKSPKSARHACTHPDEEKHEKTVPTEGEKTEKKKGSTTGAHVILVGKPQ